MNIWRDSTGVATSRELSSITVETRSTQSGRNVKLLDAFLPILLFNQSTKATCNKGDSVAIKSNSVSPQVSKSVVFAPVTISSLGTNLYQRTLELWIL